MAQLRHDYPAFRELNAEVLVIVPNGPAMIGRYVKSHAPSYPILSDKGAAVAESYGIGARKARIIDLATFKPGIFLVNQAGRLVYTNYLASYIHEPDNREPLAVLAALEA
jgi:peroxiredoxin